MDSVISPLKKEPFQGPACISNNAKDSFIVGFQYEVKATVNFNNQHPEESHDSGHSQNLAMVDSSSTYVQYFRLTG